MSKIVIKLDARGFGTVHVDGQKIKCSGFTLERKTRERFSTSARPVLTLTIQARDGVEIEADDAVVVKRPS